MRTAPITRDIPMQLETPRLLIRCPAAGDGVAVFAGRSCTAKTFLARSIPANKMAMDSPFRMN